MIDHDRFRMLAADALDAELSMAADANLDAHLATCPACRSFAAALARDLHGLRELSPTPVSPRVRAVVLDAARGRERRTAWPLLAAAALLVLAAAAGAIVASGALPRLLTQVPPSTSPAGTFAAPVDVRVGSALWAVQAVDLDNDGDLDLVVANAEDVGTVGAVLGDGTGRFGGLATYPGNFPVALRLADLDLDGFADAVLANAGPDSITVLPGDGSGGFGHPAIHPANQQPRDVVVGSFNGDRWPDVASANASSNDVSSSGMPSSSSLRA